jgi:putative exosortase-associated protein (TIGR04073 family)
MTEPGSLRRWTVICTFLAAIWLVPAPCLAQTAARKCLRGLAAMTTGVLELPGNMVAETRAKGPAEGIPLGFAKGLGMIVVRELVGVYEFLSAPFPAPAGYRPIIEPEFPWSYFEESSTSARRTTPSSPPPRHTR